jgi:hypothetical protein
MLGLRCLTIELRVTEIDELIRRGLLTREARNDERAIAKALGWLLDRTPPVKAALHQL